jgi:Kef-type K+ transport system membrane component KefB
VRWFLFVVLAAFSWAARALGTPAITDPAGSALLSLGILIIGGVLAGELAVRFRAPRITGYLLLGIVAGPHAMVLQTAGDAGLLGIFAELALGLIALTAGGEFRLDVIRRRARTLAAITASHVVVILGIVGGTAWLLLGSRPFLGSMTAAEVAAAAAILGVIAVAKSPSTTIAIITELRARGELVETVLGVTILKDLVILLLFTATAATATSLVGGGAVELEQLVHVAREIGVSLLVGAVLGLVLGVYLVKVNRLVPLTVLVLALASAELARDAGVEHLLVCMAAGFTARNVYPTIAGRFLDGLEQSSTPVYVVFFALIGAGLDLAVFASVWLPALIYVAVRMFAVWVATRVPAALVGSSRAVVSYGWMGFVAQAGLSLGFASRIQRELPGIGITLATLVVASVVVNQLIGPVLWERAILAAGEQGQAGK